MAYITPLLLFVLIQFAILAECKKNLKVSVYYETACPSCIYFFQQQFGPNWKIFFDVVEFDFIPYGHATQRYVKDDWEFECQHGPNECEGNQIHACAIHKLARKNLQGLYEYLVCCMKTLYTPANARECAKTHSINYNPIDMCSNSKSGRRILASVGVKSKKLHPKYVATIVFNDVYNEQDDADARTNLKAAICSRLANADKPKECSDSCDKNFKK